VAAVDLAPLLETQGGARPGNWPALAAALAALARAPALLIRGLRGFARTSGLAARIAAAVGMVLVPAPAVILIRAARQRQPRRGKGQEAPATQLLRGGAGHRAGHNRDGVPGIFLGSGHTTSNAANLRRKIPQIRAPGK
jgi:hypothetical protein